MSKSIIDYLKEVPDPRGAQGSRDDLWQILPRPRGAAIAGDGKSLRNLENHVFTMDALHCQKKTVEAIVESNNDYIIKVKKNNPNCKRR